MRHAANKSRHPTATRLAASDSQQSFGYRIVCRCAVTVAVGAVRRWAAGEHDIVIRKRLRIQ